MAVLREIKQQHPRAELRMWCDRHFESQARTVLSSLDADVPVETILAGKFRRYHHLSVWQHILWPSLMLANVKDAFLVGFGFIQSLFKLIIWRPDVVFTKGGYVCLPVGLAAHVLRIPLVIHDSDAHPGLTNRVLGRYADTIATGAPLEFYDYPKDRTHYVGIPISDKFTPYTRDEQKAAKGEWGVASDQPLIVVTGGGLGARRVNNTVEKVLKKLQRFGSVVLVSGQGQYDELRSLLPPDSDRFQLHPFVSNMHSLLGAADIVVTRAGATTILELAALAKPTILIPNAALTGGHQLKNAAVYEQAGVVMVLDEDEMVERPDNLVDTIKVMFDEPRQTRAMAKRFMTFSKPNAAKEMAELILKARK